MVGHEGTISGVLIICGAPQPAIQAARLDRLGGWPERVILLEPLGTSKLGAAAGLLSVPGIEIIPALPAAEDGEATLVLYSLPGLRGLSPALPVLKDLFPGLSERDSRLIETLSGKTLQDRLGPVEGPVHLWIDMPGAEIAALEALEQAGLLAQAETVTLHCGAEAFFEGGSDCAALRDRLQARLFEMVLRDDSDPDWPDLVMRQDIAARERTRLEEALAARDSELQELRGVTGLQVADLEARGAEITSLEGRLAAIQAELQDQRAAKAQQAETLAARELDLVARDETIRDLRSQMGERTSEIGHLAEQVDSQAQQIAGQRAELEAFALHVAELQALVETRDSQLVARDSEIERLGNEVQAGTQQAEQLRAEGGLRAERLTALSNEVERLKGLIETGRQQISEQRQKLATQTAEIETKAQRITQLEAEAKSLTDTARTRTQRIEALEKDLASRTAKVQELQQKLGERDARDTERVAEIGRLKEAQALAAKQSAATQETLTERQAELTRLSGLVAEGRQTINALRDQLGSQQQVLAQAQAARDAATGQLEQARADQALQMRMQVMHKLDLDDLRGRYEKSEARRRQQEELLRKLTPRLAQAAEQLRHLQLPSGMAPVAMLDAEPPVAEAPKPRASRSRKTTTAKAGPKAPRRKPGKGDEQ